VEDADEAVRQGSEGLMMGPTTGSLAVVVRPSAGRPADRRESPQVARVCETTVAIVPGEAHQLGPGGLGDRRAPRVAPPGAGVEVAARIVPELNEHPGPQHGTPHQASSVAADLNRRLIEGGVEVFEIELPRATLEERFLEITHRMQEEVQA
jgi:hypothetical protein